MASSGGTDAHCAALAPARQPRAVRADHEPSKSHSIIITYTLNCPGRARRLAALRGCGIGAHAPAICVCGVLHAGKHGPSPAPADQRGCGGVRRRGGARSGCAGWRCGGGHAGRGKSVYWCNSGGSAHLKQLAPPRCVLSLQNAQSSHCDCGAWLHGARAAQLAVRDC